MYIDSHAHLTSAEVLPHLKEVLSRAKDAGLEKIVNICTDVETLQKGLELQSQVDWVYNTAATTPHDVEKEGEIFFPIVEQKAKDGLLVAIGETGLDYHYQHSPIALQKKFLVAYFRLAVTYSLPVVIHCRDAFEDLFTLADAEFKDRPLLLHCFTGTVQEAKAALDRGWRISFSGIVTFKKSEALREAAAMVPLDRILVETDTPYLAPQSKRGKPNEPSFLPETVALLAGIKGMDVPSFAKITVDNAEQFFSFSKQKRRV